jgi:hypothetical protein
MKVNNVLSLSFSSPLFGAIPQDSSESLQQSHSQMPQEVDKTRSSGFLDACRAANSLQSCPNQSGCRTRLATPSEEEEELRFEQQCLQAEAACNKFQLLSHPTTPPPPT